MAASGDTPGTAAAEGGIFVTFEGGEASGKSTQARLLARALERRGHRVLRVAEPGGTPLGRRVRRTVKYAPLHISPTAEAFLFLAARAQLVEEVVRPTLERGDSVVCDRYADSTLAYQGHGRGLDVGMLRRLNDVATEGVWPDVTVLLDLPVDDGLQRRPSNARDRFDAELPGRGETTGPGTAGFHERVRLGFLSLAGEAPDRWLVVDARLPRAEVARRVRERVLGILAARGGPRRF